MVRIRALVDKEHREITNTWLAVGALCVSLLTLGVTQYQQWAGTREHFSINVEVEHNGPIGITEIGKSKFFEGFARLVITNQAQRRLAVSRIEVSMKNHGVISLSTPIIFTTRENGASLSLPFVALIEPVYSTAVKTSVPIRYEIPLQVPFSLEPYEQKAAYLRVRSQILESQKVIDALEDLLRQNSHMTAGQFFMACIEKGYGRPVQIQVGDNLLTQAVGGPDRTALEVRVRSSGGVLRSTLIAWP